MNNEKLIAFTQDLVRIPSLSGQEGAVARRVEEEMTALGFDRVWSDECGNVIGVVEGTAPGPTVLYDATRTPSASRLACLGRETPIVGMWRTALCMAGAARI